MRVKLVFDMQSIPVAYRLGTLSILKEMIKNGSETYYDYLFVQNRRQMKPFAYSTYINNLDIRQNMIYGNELHLNVSSSSYEFIMHLMNGSQKGQAYLIKGSRVTLKRKSLLPKKTITEENVVFRTLSPILIESKDNKPLLATDSNFANELAYVAELVLREASGKEMKQPIKVVQTMMTKQVLKENLHQEQDKPLYLTTNKGLIQLQGDPEDLQGLYDNGISMRRSLGLGLLEMEKEVN
ncbi:CRISPR-associated endoribonuclease Cas6 [Lentibacillus cibarius]|uniref:CRISPR-associated endoribonuclease Cas6 n=1 Tax=Lentibacillus cibarius TaxID=2583219 RepID=A0A549YEE8_9BACI|nr:CRISPR-associated endoribonuclease Cas6 [Lentibacillus cibarius]TMN21382.1 CRISPR-associated endoribonuclease Cas6 [Lentibacillus cibarius]TRM10261.1 CRISPR-associated endoribonuclease Cas6 [Lentibacillus cibarius]